MAAGDSLMTTEAEVLQRRLRRFSWVVGVMAFVTTPINLYVSEYVETAPAQQPANPGLIRAAFIISTVVSLAVAWRLSPPRVWELRALRRLEAAYLFTGTLACAGVIATTRGRVDEVYICVAVAGLLVLGRTLLVPSSPRRTVWLSSAAMIPVLVALVIQGLAAPRTEMPIVTFIANMLVLSAMPIYYATMSSRIFTGLREEVRTAQRLGQYTLGKKIGEGGMGTVYMAQHALLRRPTAIKILRADRGSDAAMRRFEHEVQITAELTDPHVVAIFDYGRSPDGTFYYAMEYLDGIDLERLVHDFGPQPASRVVAIIRQVCEALAEAHARQLIHRDIKPANIVLCERGLVADAVKVLDFGLVHRVDAEVAEIAGTPGYLAPEAIIANGQVGAASDLYAVGAVAYFLLTGQTVFTARTVAEMAEHHLHSPPVPPSQRTDRQIPRDLETVVMRCLEKVPSERLPTANALRDALDTLALPPWTAAEADAWWRMYRARPATSAMDAAASTIDAVGQTLVVAQR